MTTPTVTETERIDRARQRFCDLLAEDEPTWVGIPFTDLHDECDPNAYVNEAVDAEFNEPHGDEWLRLCNAVTDAYETWRTSQPWQPEQLEHTIAKVYALVLDGTTAEPMHGHSISCMLYTASGDHLIVTDEWYDPSNTTNGGDGGEWLVGIYTAEQYTDGDVTAYVGIKNHDTLIEYVRTMLNDQPEGTDWAAWAVQWTSDAIDDERLLHAELSPQ